MEIPVNALAVSFATDFEGFVPEYLIGRRLASARTITP
jgi:hypothetical protein